MGIRDDITTRLSGAYQAIRGAEAPDVTDSQPTQDADPAAAATATMSGGWQNAVTGMGIEGIDRNTFTSFTRRSMLSQVEIDWLYEQDGIAARVVDRPVHDMTREGFKVITGADPEKDEALKAELRRLECNQRLGRAWTYERKNGGAAILVNIDGQNQDELWKPMPSFVRGITDLTALSSCEMDPVQWSKAGTSEDAGRATVYQVYRVGYTATAFRVHTSRLLKFGDKRLNASRSSAYSGWGPSLYETLWDQLRNVGVSDNSASQVIQEFNKIVWKMKGLAAAKAAGMEERIRARLRVARMGMGSIKALLLDADKESAEVIGASAQGLPELLDKFRLAVSAVSGIPYIFLYGDQLSGLSTEGGAVIRNYYDEIRGRQVARQEPVEGLISLLFRVPKWGKGLREPNPFGAQEPDRWSIEWNSLWQLTSLEDAELQTKLAQADALNIQNQVYGPEEARTRYIGEGTRTDLVLEENPDDFELDPEEDLPEEITEVEEFPSGYPEEEEEQDAEETTGFPTSDDNETVSLKNSRFPQFDRRFAEKVRKENPDVWRRGGAERGPMAFVMWGRARAGKDTPSVQGWIREREAWAMRHFKDFRLPGIVAAMKWGVAVDRGVPFMKQVVREAIEKGKA